MLEIKNISFGYNNSDLLFDDISFTLNNGESLQLCGTNGVGKTTLLNCISQFLKVKSGDILFDGHSIIKYRPSQLYKIGIRRIFQDRLGFDNMLVEEQLLLVHNNKTINDIIEIFPDIKNLLKSNFMKLSGGEKMMVALSMCFRTNEKLLILDEPFNALSPNNIDKIIFFLNNIINEGVSVLIVDHSNLFKTKNIFKINKKQNGKT